MSTIEALMDRAIALSRESLMKPGAAPFGCVVVQDGRIVGEGVNHSAAHYDPTSHGEVEAIRDACRNLKTLRLEDCDLYTSCEPCSLCVATMTLVGIRKLFYAASLDQSGPALAVRMPTIDIPTLRAESGSTLAERRMPSQQHKDREALDVLEAWARG